MIKKIGSLEKNFSLTKAAIIIAVLTLVSRFLGFLRSALFASLLGPGDELDAYYAAFRIPDLIFNLLILGTLSVAFIPVFVEEYSKDKKQAIKTANSVLNFSLLLVSAICLCIYVLSPWLIKIIVPGFSGQKLTDTLHLTQLLLFTPVIFTASNLASSVLNSQKKFLAAGLAPIFYNLGIIFGFLFLYPKYGFTGWGIGVILGALLHFLSQIPAMFKVGFFWQPVLDIKNAAVKKIGRLFLPRIFGIDSVTASLVIATVIGSNLKEGSISVFNLANDLQAVPLGIFAFSVSIASFPSLSEYFSKQEYKNYYLVLRNGLEKILFFILPISLLTLLLRAYIVRIAFGRGEFNWEDTISTFSILGIFSLSMFSQAINPLLARAFYSRQNTTTPMIANLLAMATNGLCSYLFAIKFGMGVLGIAAGFTVSSWLYCAILFILLQKVNIKDCEKNEIKDFNTEIFNWLFKLALCSAILGLTTYFSLQLLAMVVNTRTAMGIFLQSATAALLGICSFIIFGSKLGIPQIRQGIDFFKKIA